MALLAMAASVLAGGVRPVTVEAAHTKFTMPLRIPPVLTDPNVTLTAQEADVQVLPGAPTRMWTYNGTFPGPTIRWTTGETKTLTLVNDLPPEAGDLTLHHHGNHSAPSEDGQPHSYLVPRGGARTYTYGLREDGQPERAATQWYHDHRMDVTGRNVWMGLAGMSILDDRFDKSLPLPSGKFDVPLMVAERKFDANNQIPYTFRPHGPITDHFLVNGVAEPYFEVAARKYRFRILNAGNVGFSNFTLSNNQDMIQIGTDSGLLPAPVVRKRFFLGAGERIEVVIDFSGQVGENIVLRTTAGQDVMQFRVTGTHPDHSSVPEQLRPAPTFGPPDETRIWRLGEIIDPVKGSIFTINGNTFDHERVDAFPKLNSTEKWIFVNESIDSHLMHIHDVDWRLLSRNGQPPPAHEAGLKETFLIGLGGTLEVTSKFTDHVGRYVFHCHLLEHEDQSMMAQFEVVPAGGAARHSHHGRHHATSARRR
ncbi:MAG: multicopper oxidase family protein [Actinomycetota bacterium]|nr:multicopper oxidase family protein [Actinomycetota bacterium]